MASDPSEKRLAVTVFLNNGTDAGALMAAGFAPEIARWIKDLKCDAVFTHATIRMLDFEGDCTLLYDVFYLEPTSGKQDVACKLTGHGVSRQFHSRDGIEWKHVSTSYFGNCVK